MKTLVILNPHAGGGRAPSVWARVSPLLARAHGPFQVITTQNPQEVPAFVRDAYREGARQVISVGGDGTNQSLINALIPDYADMTFGCIPVGTGRDWARSLGTPLSPEAAAQHLKKASQRTVDVGRLTVDGQKTIYFLNIASLGLGGEVDRRVNNSRVRRPWTFLQATVASILQYEPQRMSIQIDGETWFKGDAFLVVVANGTTFGHGMRITPQAKMDDGLFDVLLIPKAPRLRILAALRRVYDGSHLTHPLVRFRQAASVEISAEEPLPLDLDGEYAQGQQLRFEIAPATLNIFV